MENFELACIAAGLLLVVPEVIKIVAILVKEG